MTRKYYPVHNYEIPTCSGGYDALEVSIDYLVGKTDLELDKNIIDKIISIQKLPAEDRKHIMYTLDGLIQHAKTRVAYNS